MEALKKFADVIYLEAKDKKPKAPAFPDGIVEGIEGIAGFEIGSDQSKTTLGYIIECARKVGMAIPDEFHFGIGQVFFDGANIDEVRLDGITLNPDDERPTRYKTELMPSIQFFYDSIWQRQDETRAYICAIVEAAEEEHSPKVSKGAAIRASFDFSAIEEIFEDWKTTQQNQKQALPTVLPHPTFIEARQLSNAISDGRDGRHWGEIQGAFALLHCPPKSQHQTRFEPNAMMLNWWGVSSAQPQTLYDELARLNLDAVILFQVTLSAILRTEKARWSNVSLDSIIKLIGRDTDARRSAKAREEWRRKVWRCLVLFDSMTVYGTRPGVWKEPGSRGTKRAKMDAQTLYSRDPLIRIVGTRDTEQGTFDGSAPPKEVSIVPGDWLMQFHGNREFLAEMGNVLQIAQISRGKPSGAWAACAGLMLNQLWREEATRATKGHNSRGRETKTEVLKFRPFTRRELLADTVRSDYDVNVILDDPKNRSERVKSYWKEAVKELKKVGVIGHYAELKGKPGDNWREEWLDQPLDIRPVGETLENALIIHDTAAKAKRRTAPRAKPKQAPESHG